MTLIATFRTNDVPIIIGDLLLSGLERSDVDLSVPSAGKVTNVFPQGSGWSIIGLTQKVNIISDNCVVAWTGRRIEARSVIKELRELARSRPLTCQTIGQYFSELDAATANQVEMIGWIKDDAGFTNFSYPAKVPFDSGSFHGVQVGGMAANTFQAMLASVPDEFSEFGSNTEPLVHAISTTLMALGEAWRVEQCSQKTLVEYFGRGWEIAAFCGDKFAKVGSITHLLWTANLMPDGPRLQRSPELVVKQDYVEDILLMRVARLTGPTNTADQECYAVSPVYADVSLEKKQQIKQFPLLDFNSQFTCHYVTIHSPSGGIVVTGLVEYSARTFDGISLPPYSLIVDTGLQLRIVVKPEFERQLLEAAKRATHF